MNRMINSNKCIQPDYKFKTAKQKKYMLTDELYDGMNIWLIKPNDFNRGRGVKLFNSLEQLRKLLTDFTNGNEIDYHV